MNTPPNRLRYFRTMFGYSEKEVSEYLNLKNEKAIVRWENGDAYPSIIQLFKLGALYHVLHSDLYPDLNKKFVLELKVQTKTGKKK